VPAARPPSSAANTPGKPLAAPVWKNRDYMLLWGGQVVSALGSSALSVVYPLVTSLTLRGTGGGDELQPARPSRAPARRDCRCR